MCILTTVHVCMCRWIVWRCTVGNVWHVAQLGTYVGDTVLVVIPRNITAASKAYLNHTDLLCAVNNYSCN